MNDLLIIAAWLLCGTIAWMACLADFYSIGKKFPILGTADEQWSKDRAGTLPLAVIMFVSGPLGLIVAIICTRAFRTGLRIW